jgi:glycosyltransferase involved in cell wall biosynthesis
VDNAELLTTEDYEILILDSGSTDNTAAEVLSLMEQYKNVRYRLTEHRGGIDNDLSLAVSLVSGRYIWLFSGDDLLVSGWDRYIKSLLISNDIVLVPAKLCNIDMSERRANPIFRLGHDEDHINFSVFERDGSLDAYLQRAESLDALFGFMSSVIVRSEFWHSLPERRDYFGSCWAHCVRLIQGFQRGCTITYLPKFLIKKRGGNDSFMEKGFVGRIAISVFGWQKIIEEFFKESKTQALTYSLLRHDISISLFIYGKVSAQTSAEYLQLKKMARTLYEDKYPTFMSKLQYNLFIIAPVAPWMAPLLNILLPYVIRIRHWAKKKLM